MSNSISIFTDGAWGNPGPGGWGVLIVLEGEEITLYGGENNTTNNQMEMMAAIKALEYFQEKKSIELVTDSSYLKDGIEKMDPRLEKNGWKTSAKKQVKNQELWMKIDVLNNFHEVKWKWVKGHSGHRENEIADLLANKGIDEL